jgi:hypothetical protein
MNVILYECMNEKKKIIYKNNGIVHPTQSFLFMVYQGYRKKIKFGPGIRQFLGRLY